MATSGEQTHTRMHSHSSRQALNRPNSFFLPIAVFKCRIVFSHIFDTDVSEQHSKLGWQVGFSLVCFLTNFFEGRLGLQDWPKVSKLTEWLHWNDHLKLFIAYSYHGSICHISVKTAFQIIKYCRHGFGQLYFKDSKELYLSHCTRNCFNR